MIFLLLALIFSINPMDANARGIDESIGFEGLTQEKADNIHSELSAELGHPKGLSRFGALGRVSILRLLVEASYIPEAEARDFSYNSMSGGVLLNVIKDADFIFKKMNFSLKAHYSKSDLKTIQDGGRADPGTTTYENEVMGTIFLMSVDEYSIRPFFGIGKVKSTGSLKFDATDSGGTIFDSSSTLAGKTSASLEDESLHFPIGAEWNFLFIFNFSLEMARAFDTSTSTLKFSFDI